MSLAINPNKVTAILLADGWHPVAQGSLAFDAFEFVEDGYGSAQPRAESTGLEWHEPINPLNPDSSSWTMFAPLNAVLAVRYGAITL